MSVELAAELERCLLTVWPAVTTQMIDGWAVRFANGYSARANSASALRPGAQMTDALLNTIIPMYRAAGLPTQVRVTPAAHHDTASFLKARGFQRINQAITMTAPLTQPLAYSHAVKMLPTPEPIWLKGVSMRQSGNKRNPEHLHAIVSRLRVPAVFAVLEIEHDAVGFGLCAIDRGWAEFGNIMIDAAHRGKGLGRALVSSLLHWAQNNDARHAFLQVDAENTVAINLYRSLGFVHAYDYETWALPQPTQ
jgi:N-acetylglutamate synthase